MENKKLDHDQMNVDDYNNSPDEMIEFKARYEDWWQERENTSPYTYKINISLSQLYEKGFIKKEDAVKYVEIDVDSLEGVIDGIKITNIDGLIKADWWEIYQAGGCSKEDIVNYLVMVIKEYNPIKLKAESEV